MKHLIRILLVLITIPGIAVAAITDVSGADVITQKSVQHNFPSDAPATVVIFVSAKCPCSASHEVLLKTLADEFKEFKFLGVHSNSDEDAEITKAHFAGVQLPFPVLQDQKNILANRLGALKTPHAFVLGKDGTILYQGGVTDSHVGPTAKKHYLKEVLEDLRAGKPLRHKEGRALGCYIQREEE